MEAVTGFFFYILLAIMGYQERDPVGICECCTWVKKNVGEMEISWEDHRQDHEGSCLRVSDFTWVWSSKEEK